MFFCQQSTCGQNWKWRAPNDDFMKQPGEQFGQFSTLASIHPRTGDFRKQRARHGGDDHTSFVGAGGLNRSALKVENTRSS
jgi:hypothetical protein